MKWSDVTTEPSRLFFVFISSQHRDIQVFSQKYRDILSPSRLWRDLQEILKEKSRQTSRIVALKTKWHYFKATSLSTSDYIYSYWGKKPENIHI